MYSVLLTETWNFNLKKICISPLTIKEPKLKITELAKSVNLDEAAHYEPPHLDLRCLPVVYKIFNTGWLGQNFCFAILQT